MWLNLQRPSQVTQELKSNLFVNIKPTLLHYLETSNTWLQMTKSAFTDGFFPTLSNYEGALQGMWSQSITLIRMWVVPDCYRQLSRSILWIKSVSVTYWRHSTPVCVQAHSQKILLGIILKDKWMFLYCSHSAYHSPGAIKELICVCIAHIYEGL